MEIRFQPRQTGVTTWLLNKAIDYAKSNPFCDCHVVSPTNFECEMSWMSSKSKLSKFGTIRKSSTNSSPFSVLFPNGSVIDYIIPTSTLSSNVTRRQFFFIDNAEGYNRASYLIFCYNAHLFDDAEDMFIGGTDDRIRKNFRIGVDYGTFCKNCDIRNYIDEFDNIHDFVVDSECSSKDVLMLRCLTPCKACDNCPVGNGSGKGGVRRSKRNCLRIGNFFFVKRSCPFYAEVTMWSLNNCEEMRGK